MIVKSTSVLVMDVIGLDDCNEEEKNVWLERAKQLLNEDPEKTDERIDKLKELVNQEEGLKVPDERSFYLKFLRAGLNDPHQAFNIMKNYFSKNYRKYFESSLDFDKIVETTFKQEINCMLPHRCINLEDIFI